MRLIVIPEGALQGSTDEVFDWDHQKYAEEIAIDIPGPETDQLGKIAREFNCYLVATAKAHEPEFPGLFFNIVFLLSPQGKVILKHRKNSPLFPVEHSVCPHDVWDKWIEIHGRSLDAFFPVADTELGKIGLCMANEGSYPELIRGLAMNGAEVICRPAYPEPHVGNGAWEIQNRARALDNTCYMVAPNLGTYYLLPESSLRWIHWRSSMIVDFKGRIFLGMTMVRGRPIVAASLISKRCGISFTLAAHELDEGSADGSAVFNLREPRVPKESLVGANADEARGVPHGSDRAADSFDAGTRHFYSVCKNGAASGTDEESDEESRKKDKTIGVLS